MLFVPGNFLPPKERPRRPREGKADAPPLAAARNPLYSFGTPTGTFVSARASYTQGADQGPADFQSLVDLHYAALYRFAVSLTRSENDAADLVQGTFLTWAAKGHQLLDRSKAKAWLFTTLHRAFLESQRRVTRFPHLEISSAEEELPSVEFVEQLDSQSVLDLLARVDPQYQAAVALFYLEDYSYLEIAEILQVPLGTVKSRIARGLTQLKNLVQKAAVACKGPDREGA